MPVSAVYTFYPCGQIAIQVRVRQERRVLHLEQRVRPAPVLRRPQGQARRNPGYTFSTPTAKDFKDGFQGKAEELVLAVSPKVEARFLLTIPVESETLFDRHMRHDGRSVNWDRAGTGARAW